MSSFSDDLLRASARLYTRRRGQKGPLKSAYIRRSISTTYYAMFHFVLDEMAVRLVGAGNDLRQRRRLLIRTLSHTGLSSSVAKLKGAVIERSVEDLFRLPSTPLGAVSTPDFVQRLAAAYLDAKAKREDADHNLNEPLSQTDAHQLRRRVIRAIRDWQAATAPPDRDTKHAVAILISLKGKLKE